MGDDPNSGTGFWTGGSEEPSVAPPVTNPDPGPPVVVKEYYSKPAADAFFTTKNEARIKLAALYATCGGAAFFMSAMYAYLAAARNKGEQAEHTFDVGPTRRSNTRSSVRVDTTDNVTNFLFTLRSGDRGQRGRDA